MKFIFRQVGLNLLSLYLVHLIYPGFSIEQQPLILITASVVWMILNRVVKPIIKLLLLPINLITLGFFSWTIGVITLFILQNVVTGITISSYNFPGFTYQGFVVPAANITLFFSFIIISILLNLIHSFIIWLIKN